MLSEFNRKYSIVALNNQKIKEFKYCVLSYDGDIHELLAEQLIKDNKILSYLKENDIDSLSFLKENLKDKLRKLKSTIDTRKNGYNKNDGIYMNFLAYEMLKESYGVEPLYLLQKSDVENPKFGLDSVFYKGKSLWIFEFKTSTNNLNEEKVATQINKGVDSLFCKEGTSTASLFNCKTTVKENSLDPLLNVALDRFIDNRNDVINLLSDSNLIFNVCVVSPSGEFDDETIKQYILEKYIKCKECDKEGKVCKQYKCSHFEKISIINAFHLQLPTTFSLEKLYDKLLERI